MNGPFEEGFNSFESIGVGLEKTLQETSGWFTELGRRFAGLIADLCRGAADEEMDEGLGMSVARGYVEWRIAERVLPIDVGIFA